jgi:hypothetical protein
MAANQGSRAGLITSVVILSIVSVVAVIFAFWYAAEKRKTDQDLADLKKRYGDVITDASLNGPEVADLKALLEGLGYRNVRTHLQSGNAVFATDEPAGKVGPAIEAAIEARAGLVPCSQPGKQEGKEHQIPKNRGAGLRWSERKRGSVAERQPCLGGCHG